MIRWRWVVPCVVLGASSYTFGQTNAPAAPSPQGQSTDQIATYRTNANLVLVDVVVRDKGKPVQGLKTEDFQILEDGKPQKIATFEEHKATDAVRASTPPPLPPHVFSDQPTYALSSAANVLLLDALNTPVNDQKYARAQMVRYLRTIPPGTRAAVFTLGSRLQMVAGFTTDLGVIAEAIKGKQHGAEKSPIPDSVAEASASGVSQFGSDVSGQMATSALEEFDRETDTFNQDVRVRMTIAVLEQLGRYLSTIPGRKNLIWVSAGVPISLDPDLSHPDAGEVRNYGPALEETSALLARARVAVYPVDARGLMTLPNANVAHDPAGGQRLSLQGAASQGFANDVGAPQKWWESHAAMDEMAKETGGEAYYDRNAVGQSAATAITEGSNYYTIGYRPANVSENGSYRKIDVRVEEAHYELAYRRGYFDGDPDNPGKALPAALSPLTAAMVHGVPGNSQILFEARVLPAGDPLLKGLQPTPGPAGTPPQPLKLPVTRTIVDYSIDPHAMVMTKLPDGRQRAELEVTQSVYDAQGKRLNFTDAGLEVTLTADQMARDLRDGMRVRQEIDVPAGEVWLRMGVRDVTSGRIGTVEIPLAAARN